MSRRPAAERRLLGLWTAGWLAVLLLALMLWLGEFRLQWPVLLVPVLWALVAVRPRRRRDVEDGDVENEDGSSYWDGPDHWDDGENPYRPPSGGRTDTVERPSIRDERDRRG
jgi:hypothetical protein